MNGYLAPNLRLNLDVQVSQLRQAWMFVGKAFQDGHRACEECKYCAHTQEPRAYGEGTVYEGYTECTLGQRTSEVPEMCPAYLSHLEEQAEEALDSAVDGLGAV